MSEELSQELRQWARFGYGVAASVCMDDAADLITTLRAENELMREALEKVADYNVENGRGIIASALECRTIARNALAQVAK